MITLENPFRKFKLNLPTKLNEITPEVLTAYTKGVRLPDNYTIIALVGKFKVSSFEFVTSIESFKGNTMETYALLAKTDNESKCKFNVGEKLIMNKADIEMASHLALPIAASVSSFIQYITVDKDKINTANGTAIVEERLNLSNYSKDYVYLLQFKIVPLNAIKGSFANDICMQDPFIITNDN